MQLGIRAHDFGKLPLEQLATAIEAKGFNSIQLALAKALPQIDSSLGRLNPGLANYIGETFHKHHIQIAVLGCYINPVDPDLESRRKALARFKEHIRFARDFGCSVVATETGHVNADGSSNPAKEDDPLLQELIESIGELVEEAEKFGVFVCVEAVSSHTMSTPKKVKKVLDAINSTNLQVLFDPVNITPVETPAAHECIIKESLDLFGDQILMLHAKDFIIENGAKKTTPIGKGLLNWEFALKEILARKPYINILVEDNKTDMIDESANHLRSLLQKMQI